MDPQLADLSMRVGTTLSRRRLLLGTAESCTGGWIAKLVTDVPGSSGWFECGLVTYSNAAKQSLLGVRAETLEVHGAVSETTVREMAEGVLARTRADISLAVSGIAGPGGALPDKPVGTVCLAWATRGGPVRAETVYLEGEREAVRRQAAVLALEGVLTYAGGER